MNETQDHLDGELPPPSLKKFPTVLVVLVVIAAVVLVLVIAGYVLQGMGGVFADGKKLGG
ncbi:MAG TPA: hypothetical protein VGL61_12945 [Kofleriaceae bacterium]|jgi:hypothetical protein